MKKFLFLLLLLPFLACSQGNSPQYSSLTRTTSGVTFANPGKGLKVYEYSDSSSGKSPVFSIRTSRFKLPRLALSTDTSVYTRVLAASGDSLAFIPKSYYTNGKFVPYKTFFDNTYFTDRDPWGLGYRQASGDYGRLLFSGGDAVSSLLESSYGAESVMFDLLADNVAGSGTLLYSKNSRSASLGVKENESFLKATVLDSAIVRVVNSPDFFKGIYLNTKSDLGTRSASFSVESVSERTGARLAQVSIVASAPGDTLRSLNITAGQKIEVRGDVIRYSPLGRTTVSDSLDVPCWRQVSRAIDTLDRFIDSTYTPGSMWTARTTPVDNNWRSVAYGNGIFVATATTGTGNRVMTSPDGVRWTVRTSPQDNNWTCVVFANGLFVAVAASGTNRVMTSPDGITWTLRNAASANGWVGLCFGNGLFVATSSTGVGNRVMTSPDGINWTSRTSPADNNWQSVAFGNNLFVAVASSGTSRVMTSPDGITWTLRTSANEAQLWWSVVYGNGLFVACNAQASATGIMTSPDGITWTARATPTGNDFASIAYGGGVFVATSPTGAGSSNFRVITSKDGITWAARRTPVANSWYTIAYGNGLFVSVAMSGTGNRVMTSGSQQFSSIPNAYSFIGPVSFLGGVTGTNTNNSAVAGQLGEFVFSCVPVGSAVSLTTATTANIASISLTAGDWDVEGNLNFSLTSATSTNRRAAISSATATMPTDGSEVNEGAQFTTTTATDGISMPRKRISLNSTLSVFLVGQATFSAGTVSGYGCINARRVR